MKIPVNWLKDYLVSKLSVHQIAKALQEAGVEVEQIIVPKPLNKKVVVGLVKKVVQHPNADKLKLTQVDVGSEVLGIVCGAPNVAEGQKVAVAMVGAVLPGEFLIKQAVIRGEQSSGMLCSAEELGIGADHSGILELPEDFKVGKSLAQIWAPEPVLEIATAANRPDLQSVIGVAREVAAITGTKLHLPALPEVEYDSKPKAAVIESKNASRYQLTKLEISHLKPTPFWLITRLMAAGVRPINLAVDITNYVMLEWGQPLHAFDASKVKLPIKVRQARKGEKLTTLDAAARQLTENDLVIADSNGPVALAGVMGGENSAINSHTKSILLESATFHSGSVRKAAVRHTLRTDASARYERGLPVQLAPFATARAIALLGQLTGAKLQGEVSDLLQVWPWVAHIGTRPSRVSKLLGIEVKTKTIVDKLRGLGFEADQFDISAVAREQLGKPYRWGANFRTDGVDAFDCSYLADYLYSLIGKQIGHTALGQFMIGKPVNEADLLPGDLLFYEGTGTRTVTDHYYSSAADGTKVKHVLKKPLKVGHTAIYVGKGRVVGAFHYEFKGGKWVELTKPRVIEVPVEDFTSNPGYLGARRYVKDLEDYIAVTVPWWRPDVRLEEDLLEEVVRQIGYDKVPATLPAWNANRFTPNRLWPNLWRTKTVLKGLGLFEVNTYSFVSRQQLTGLGLVPEKHLKLKNPLSLEQAYLRSGLMPSLVTALVKNKTHSKEFGLYEISKVFLPAKTGLPDEPLHLGAVFLATENSYAKAKQALDSLTGEFNVAIAVKSASLPSFHPTKAAKIMLNNQQIGVIGELHPETLAELKINSSVGYLEIDLGAVFGSSAAHTYKPISRFPSISRDLAVVVKNDVTWAEVKQVLDSHGQSNAEFLSDYYGADLDHGYKSVAMRLTFSSMELTLTEPQADKELSEVVTALAKAFGAKVRK